MSRFELQITPDTHRFGLSGSLVFLPTLTGSLPHSTFASAFWDGPVHTWLAGLNLGATVHYTGQYQDDNLILATSAEGPGARKVREWTTLDLIASYTFSLPASLAQQQVAGYAKDGGQEKNLVPSSTTRSVLVGGAPG